MLANVLTSAASWNEGQPLLAYLVPASLEHQVRAGQLVAVPYGERVVEGIIWDIQADESDALELSLQEDDVELRPLHSILDPEPALWPHQRALAEWMADYYVTPLAQVAMMMLPPGLMQSSRIVLTLVDAKQASASLVGARNSTHGSRLPADAETEPQIASPQLQAVIGWLLEDRELDIEQLKEMLGPTRAKKLLKEAAASNLIAREPQLSAPRTRPRRQRVVRLLIEGEALKAWRAQTEARLQQSLPDPATIALAPDNVRRKSKKKLAAASTTSGVFAASALALTPQDLAGLQAQRQLAAVELLEHSTHRSGATKYWTPNKLCKASALTPAQLQTLVREGIIAIEEGVEVQRDPMQERAIPISEPLPLTRDQQKAVQQILDMQAVAKPLLLHGVTGSGKTEVYLQALEPIIAQGKRGIVLVPEIAITTQAVQRFAGRFPGRVAIIHSALSPGERYDEWRRIRSGKVDVVVGSRSALFAPLPNLGMIILDEEHEPAYKQDERKPTYHAREVALVMGQLLRIPVVLGSATPAVETFYRAEQKIYRMVELPNRIDATLPPVEVIDLRSELHAGNTSIISRRLHAEIERVLGLGQQAILYLNRRGAASCVLCRDCGYVAMCEHCDVPLTYHATERILLCHYCSQQNKVLRNCPQCGGSSMRYFGLGTERVVSTIEHDFPTARLLRWDRDTARTRRAHEQLLDRFSSHEADILVGTQMIAKGLDIPGVTLVGVVAADIALMLPDFAASERAFTLLTQVAGRAGRGKVAGQVIIQTFNPQHFCIDAASRHDYFEFYAAEIAVRKRYGYPPFRQFVKFTYSHENRRRAQNESLLLRERLDQCIERLGLENTDIVGPAPAVMERIRDEFRWQMIARGPDLHPLLRVLETPPGWRIDIDPVSTM
ncbi:MAG: primosomal protein N' [Chloroflexota bacterium]|nr:primosomal protein N' [Chloroflexota bacterium]